jgi:hypothetical protein
MSRWQPWHLGCTTKTPASPTAGSTWKIQLRTRARSCQAEAKQAHWVRTQRIPSCGSLSASSDLEMVFQRALAPIPQCWNRPSARAHGTCMNDRDSAGNFDQRSSRRDLLLGSAPSLPGVEGGRCFAIGSVFLVLLKGRSLYEEVNITQCCTVVCP